jgi:hypothetical protein
MRRLSYFFVVVVGGGGGGFESQFHGLQLAFLSSLFATRLGNKMN